MTNFAIGDLVEIIGSEITPPELQSLIGRIGTIAALGDWQDPPLQGAYARLMPLELNHGSAGWYLCSLRRITPPDWSAPLATDEPAPLVKERA